MVRQNPVNNLLPIIVPLCFPAAPVLIKNTILFLDIINISQKKLFQSSQEFIQVGEKSLDHLFFPFG